MKNEQIIGSLCAFLLCLGVACTKQTDDLSFDRAPRITLDSISHDTLVEFQDRLLLYLSYEDGDGDLGTSDPDVNSVFVKDSRLSAADPYYLPPLAPEDSEISIQGNLIIELNPTFLLGNGDEESTVFSLFIVDRAGNESNVTETGEILLVR